MAKTKPRRSAAAMRCTVCGVELTPQVHALDVMGESDEVVLVVRLCDKCWAVYQWWKGKQNLDRTTMANKQTNTQLVLTVKWEPVADRSPLWDRLWDKLLSPATNTPRRADLDDVTYLHQDSGGER